MTLLLKHWKPALILIILATLCSCKVTKQIQKTDTETQTESKKDSIGEVHNDIKKESKIETTVTEEIDSTIFVSQTGDIVSDTSKHKGKETPIRIRKKKTTTTTEDKKEVDKSVSKSEVKAKHETKSEVKTVSKDIKKTGIPFYWWIIIAVLVAVYLSWRFLLARR